MINNKFKLKTVLIAFASDFFFYSTQIQLLKMLTTISVRGFRLLITINVSLVFVLYYAIIIKHTLFFFLKNSQFFSDIRFYLVKNTMQPLHFRHFDVFRTYYLREVWADLLKQRKHDETSAVRVRHWEEIPLQHVFLQGQAESSPPHPYCNKTWGSSRASNFKHDRRLFQLIST